MKDYLASVQQSGECFEDFTLIQIPQVESEEADALSRAAAGMHPIGTRQVTFLTINSSKKGHVTLEALNIDEGSKKGGWLKL